MSRRRGFAAALAVGLIAGGGSAMARTLEVGPGLEFSAPSGAAAVAGDGDVVSIAPGTYFDCAVWRANGLTIAATAPGVVITDRACAGKAAFIVQGDDVVIIGIGFARIRVEDGNGAGIRAEGRGLTVRDSRFVNDQAGIIAASGGFLRIENCSFDEVGSRDTDQPRAIVVGDIDALRISGSVFRHARGGGFVASSALATELTGNQLDDAEGRVVGPLVLVQGGMVTVSGNRITLGVEPADGLGAVLVRGDARDITVRGNTLVAPAGHVPLLRNWSGAAAAEADNVVPDGAMAVSDAGSLYHRLRDRAARARVVAEDAARLARHQVAQLARGLRLIR